MKLDVCHLIKKTHYAGYSTSTGFVDIARQIGPTASAAHCESNSSDSTKAAHPSSRKDPVSGLYNAIAELFQICAVFQVTH